MKTKQWACAALLAACSAGAGAVGNLADLTVYDRNEGRPLPVYWHQGRAYVVGKPGNEYQIQVRNRQGEEVLAVMSVDGVNILSGETASTQQGGYVLTSGYALEVKGWRKDLSRTAAFYFTSLPDSYAARTGRPDNVGTIGVALFRKKALEPVPFSQYAPAAPLASSPSGPMARKEAANSSGASADQATSRVMERDDRIGTGHGRTEHSPVRQVSFERATREPAETVVIYYDSYRNLLARGIIPPSIPYRPSPNPFPVFVPDPPA
jgi:hypothetical protein